MTRDMQIKKEIKLQTRARLSGILTYLKEDCVLLESWKVELQRLPGSQHQSELAACSTRICEDGRQRHGDQPLLNFQVT